MSGIYFLHFTFIPVLLRLLFSLGMKMIITYRSSFHSFFLNQPLAFLTLIRSLFDLNRVVFPQPDAENIYISIEIKFTPERTYIECITLLKYVSEAWESPVTLYLS